MKHLIRLQPADERARAATEDLEMTLFVSLFFFTYGSMHAIVLRALHRATAFRAHTRLLIVSWCLLMVTAPVLVRFFDLRGWIVPRTVMATTGYLWMAWIFLAMTMLLASVFVARFEFASYVYPIVPDSGLVADFNLDIAS